MDKFIQELTELLAKNGVSEETVNEIVEKVNNDGKAPEDVKPVDEVPPANPEPEAPTDPVDPPQDDVPAEPGVNSDPVPTEDVGVPASDTAPVIDDVQPLDVSTNPEAPVDDVPPAETVAPVNDTLPPVDNTVDLKAENEALKGELADLRKEIDNIKSALVDGGVMTKETEAIGVDQPSVPKGEGGEESFEDQLARYNRGSRF